MKLVAVGAPDTRDVRDLARRADCHCRKDCTKGTDVRRKTRAAADNLNPLGKSEQPEPWYQLDPEEALDPWGEFEEPELLTTIPMTIGPAPDGPAGPASGVDLDTGLMAAKLNWKT